MKKELKIQNAVGLCKKCFRRMRRHGSSYCGECQNEPERMKIYQDDTRTFPLLDKVVKKFKIGSKQLESIIFTYGDTIYFDKDLHYSLVAHEITHVLQQTKMGAKIWWGKYLRGNKFRLSQEIEAYQRQYESLVRNNPAQGEFMVKIMAGDLSGKMYGNIISFDEAKKLITSKN
jgi:hypothetical protein